MRLFKIGLYFDLFNLLSLTSGFVITSTSKRYHHHVLHLQQTIISVLNDRKQFVAFSSSPLFSTLSDKTTHQQDDTATEEIPILHNHTVTFPNYLELTAVPRGDFVASDPWTVTCSSSGEEYTFRLLLVPRGQGAPESTSQIRTASPLHNYDAARDNVGLYLQYLPHQKPEDTVDVTFNIRIKGNQQNNNGPKFDVDWTTGMRFSSTENVDLKNGLANDFGAYMMQSRLLEHFMGGDQAKNEPMQVQVSLKIHPPPPTIIDHDQQSPATRNNPLTLSDIRQIDQQTSIHEQHNATNVRVGMVIVPVLSKLSQRPRLFQAGAYPGVEYRLMRILDPQTQQDIFSSVPGAYYDLKPIYPLVPRLERPWPIRINERDLPKLVTSIQYNVIYAVGSLLTAVTGLMSAFIFSQLVSLFFIPSKSMDPTFEVGDVLVVEKITPRIMNKINHATPKVGDVVLFHPNDKLQEIVQSSGGRISNRDLFVKRVAARPGDSISVDKAGSVTSINGQRQNNEQRNFCEEEPLKLIERFIEPVDNQVIPEGQVFVLGGCSSVSVDSRVWGPLSNDNIVGRPVIRIWPLSRWGTVPALPIMSTTSIDADSQIHATTKREGKIPLTTHWN